MTGLCLIGEIRASGMFVAAVTELGHGRRTDLTRILVLAISLVLIAPEFAHARADNFNEGAYGSASQTGINNANCNSALVLYCDGGSSGAVYGAPIESNSLAAASGIGAGLFLMSLARRRNRRQ